MDQPNGATSIPVGDLFPHLPTLLTDSPLRVEIVQVDRGDNVSALGYFAFQIFQIVALGLVGQYVLNQIGELDPRKADKRDANTSQRAITQRLLKLDRSHIDPSSFTPHELQIFCDVVAASEVMVSFDQIGGLQDHKEQIVHSLCTPEATRAVLRKSYGKMADPAKGILLYGPPGCGKTLLAKAIATECDAAFINLKISHVTDKWHGESQKLTDAVFSLARKLAPTIVFIDEVESFLRDRGMPGADMESSCTAQMKASFLSNWDGLTSGNTVRRVSNTTTGEMEVKQLPFEIIVVGATNRAGDIDEAFLRRMPLQLKLDLPTEQGRNQILKIMFNEMKIPPTCQSEQVAKCTDSYSGSDLKELCRRAVMERVREVMQQGSPPRALTMLDFQTVLGKMRPAGVASINYKYKQRVEDALKNNGRMSGGGGKR